MTPPFKPARRAAGKPGSSHRGLASSCFSTSSIITGDPRRDAVDDSLKNFEAERLNSTQHWKHFAYPIFLSDLMSSGDDYASGYYTKMEDIIIKQNKDILSLQEHLERNNAELMDLRTELQSQADLSRELNESVSEQNNIIHVLHCDLKAKEVSINEMHNEILYVKNSLDEVELSKMDLSKEIDTLKAALQEKNIILEERNKWVAELKEDLQTAKDQGEALKSDLMKEMDNLKAEYLTQLKLFCEKSAITETFYEQQIDLLLDRIKCFSDKGLLHELEFETSQKKYKDDLNEVKVSISEIQENLISAAFLSELKDWSQSLPRWLSLETVLNQELQTKASELSKLKDELEEVKQTCSALLKQEKLCEAKIKENEIIISSLKEEKMRLQQHLAAANNKHEKATVDFNLEREELRNKFKQYVDSYESDLSVLNGSLQSLLNSLPKYLNCENEKFMEHSFAITIDSDINSIMNSSIGNIYLLLHKCLCEVENHCIKLKGVFTEKEQLNTALEAQQRFVEDINEKLKKTLDELELNKNKLLILEKEKQFLQNKLGYILEENSSYEFNIKSLKTKVYELENIKKDCESKINLLQEEIIQLKSKEKDDFKTPLSKWTLLATSTPFEDDSGACGDQPAMQHSSILKWMEKCQELVKENQALNTKINNLEMHNQDLKFTVNHVRNDMEAFQEKQSKLEEKLASYISLKKQYDSAIHNLDSKDLILCSLSKEMESLKEENIALFNKNIYLEELNKNNNSNKLSSNDGFENAFSKNAVKFCNDKARELIILKKEMHSLNRENNDLSRKINSLLEINKEFDKKLSQQSKKITLLKADLEKVIEEKLELLSRTKLLQTENDLLELRVEFLSSLHDKKCESSKLLEEIQVELLEILRSSVKPAPLEEERGGLEEVVQEVRDHISGERADFRRSLDQLHQLVTATKNGSERTEDWNINVDKLYRTILEDQKYNTQQYANFQKSLAALQSAPAKESRYLTEDKIKAVKSFVEVDLLKKDIDEKNEVIKVLLDQKDTMEKEMKELRKNLNDLEMDQERLRTLGDKEKAFSCIKISHSQVLERLDEESSEEIKEALVQAETRYHKAVEEVRALLQEESESKLLQYQQIHKQQIEMLEKCISEQAVQIGLLLDQNSDFASQVQTDSRLHFRKEELEGELKRVLSAVKVAHAVELDLVRLELTSSSLILRNKEPADTIEDHAKSLLLKMQTILKMDFSKKLKTFLSTWHSSYSKYTEDIEMSIKSKLGQLSEVSSHSDLEVEIDNSISHYDQIVSSAHDFVEKLSSEYTAAINALKDCVSLHVSETANCFEKIRSNHFNQSEVLQLKQNVSMLKLEKNDLENRHREAVVLVREKLGEVMGAVERSVEGESASALRARLEEEHRRELDHLKDYYVQMCANLEKQYTEDVNSLHSKLSDQGLSLSEDLPLLEIGDENNWELQQFSGDQVKFIEDMKCKWAGEINELKARLENKYAKKMKDIHQLLSTYIYKNELDICARCLKDEVMRECEAEIEAIGHELSKSGFVCHTNLEPATSESKIGVLTNPAFGPNLVPTNFEHSLQQQTCSLKLAQFLSNIDSILSNINNKLKVKESKLLLIQNKFNNLSQFIWKHLNKSVDSCYCCYSDLLVEDNVKLIQVIENNLINNKFSDVELQKLKNLFKELEGGVCLACDNEEITGEIMNNKFSTEDFSLLIKERDSLKEMTSTLKSAISQLINYLNTCEDELNRTVVEELVKICEEQPTEGLEGRTPRRVHFAPQVETSDFGDLSLSLRDHLDSCMNKLKLEAASLLGLTSLHPPPADLYKQIEDLKKENKEFKSSISELKLCIDRCGNCHLARGEEVFGDDSSKMSSSVLVDRAQHILSGADSSFSQAQMKLFDDLAKFGDKIIAELQKDKLDLQQQITAADKRLKSTTKFLEEQAQERENERDEYAKVVLSLQEQLKENDRYSNSQQLFSLQLQQLETQLLETKAVLEGTEKAKEVIEIELKDAIDKIWVLRDIISDLESQLSRKSEKEELLIRKLDQLEEELDHHSDTRIAMAQELESLRGQSMEDSYLEQIKQLQENIKFQFDSSVVRNIKLQLQEMGQSFERRTKELENLYLTYSTNSLSSPSEELSVVDQLACRAESPEESPSPVALPVQELSRLQEKATRHAAVEQVLIKRFRDLQLSCTKLTVQLEEVQAERDVIQHQLKKQMVQLAESNNKIDDLRHKVETAQTTANKDLVLEIQDLKQKYTVAEQTVVDLQSEQEELRNQLSHAEEIIQKQQIDMQKSADSNHQLIISLKRSLTSVNSEKLKLQSLVKKYKEEMNFDVMNALLADKNEDIDRLQQTVNQLQNKESDKQCHHNSKGHKVSFASGMEDLSVIPEDLRLRDASHQPSLNLEFSKFSQESHSPVRKDLRDVEIPHLSSASQSLTGSFESSVQEIEKMKLEAEEKSQRIAALEKEVEFLKSVQTDLKNTKTELETVLSSVSSDKSYYESRLLTLADEIKGKNEEIASLKKLISNKDEEIIIKAADIKVLKEISLNLEEKLKEAQSLAEQSAAEELVAKLQHAEHELNHAKDQLTACMNDLSDEKEISETLKSSLNILTREKVQLEDKLSIFEIENKNLSNALQGASEKLDQYSLAIRNLKNYLLSKNSPDSSKDSSLLSSEDGNQPEECELLKLKNEVKKMATLNEKLYSERLTLMEELEELKSSVLSEKRKMNDMTMKQFQEELGDLRNAIGLIKEEKLSIFETFSSEIEQLNKDIISLKESKETLLETLRNELSEKEKLHITHTKLLKELEDTKDALEKRNRKKELSFCEISILNMPPSSSDSQLDILTDKHFKDSINALTERLNNAISEKQRIHEMYNKLLSEMEENKPIKDPLRLRKKELSFCNVNILSIPPSNITSGLDMLAEKMRNELKLSESLDISLLRTINADDNLSISKAEHSIPLSQSTSQSLEKSMLQEVKNSLSEKVDKCRDLEIENSRLKVEVDRLERLVVTHNEKVCQLMKQLDFQKERNINLELTVLREQSNFKQVSLLLEHERTKGRETQKEDISLIETMRQRLQILMENEIKLKKLVLDERTKADKLLAQLNSVRALEKFNSDSNELNKKNVGTVSDEDRSKYLALRIEYEKEKQSREDLQNVLTRERAVIEVLKSNLEKSEKTQQETERELSRLKKSLNEEVLRRQIAETKIMKLQDTFDSRFQKYSGDMELRKQKELDAAYAIIGELEREHGALMKKHSELKLELHETQARQGDMTERVRTLREAVADLGQERSWLLETVTALRERLAERVDGRLPERGLEGKVEAAVGGLLRELLLVERQRKALVFQKEYLVVSLRGYPRLTGTRLCHRPSLRTVVWTVIAAIKIRRLPGSRLLRFHKKKHLLIDKIKQSLLYEPSRPPLGLPHSPPSKEIKHSANSRWTEPNP